ncbi:hypothetical protein L226DRAFT_612603 [Lentinus tigrinus ALCF2SS1-7]|uniref:uncharacterized protein n=1 Tax=Lentinus tigrinus ALCF2SS1-7 TaxID=1328758 RepID=UPI001165ED88|nr:hypothetical protein L226DRAFT_612603 [Lentinus tigrinus ALCF2SS1-7]
MSPTVKVLIPIPARIATTYSAAACIMLCNCPPDFDRPCFCDWFGLELGQNIRANEAPTGLEGGERSIADFNNHIDDWNMENTYDDGLSSGGMPSASDWMLESTMSSPFLPLAPPSDKYVMPDDTGSSTGSSIEPSSPMSISHYSATSAISDLTSMDDEDSQLSDAALGTFDFTFQYPSPSVSISSSYFPSPPATPSSTDFQFGYGHLAPQHEVGAAATDAYDLSYQPEGVQGNMNDVVFPSTPPAPPSADMGPPATLVVVKREVATGDIDVDSDMLEPEAEEKSRVTKRRKPQDTTPKFQCPLCDKKFARSNNLTVHVKSVHELKRDHKCPHPGCDRAFSRKHDLTRHFQSRHTSLGSPRNKGTKTGKKEESD